MKQILPSVCLNKLGWSAYQQKPRSAPAGAAAGFTQTLGDLIRAALTQELFETVAFEGTLAALKPGVAALCDKHLPNLPPFIDRGGSAAASAL